jgi:predicted ATPase/transcriptional regulator with XRE-family HTH domain
MEAAGRRSFGALLRQFRLDAAITQQDLAERATVSVEAISALERGARARPHRDTIALLGHALDLSPERMALLQDAAVPAHPPRRRDRSDAVNPSVLRIVSPGALATPTQNLPQQLTSFVGRQQEGGEIAALLREKRLVTVVGAGGVGKTRIAVQIGNELLKGYRDGVWLVDLAPLADQTLVPSAVLTALHLPSTTGTALDVVVAYLKARRLLLILDNCEHVIAPARELATAIVQSCPFVRILATSRAAFEVPAEQVYRLPSLAVPRSASVSSQGALSYAAVVLFVDRARAVDAGFELNAGNALDVVEICRRLDGIPLAIELAAARVNVLAPRQIARRLDERFRLLTGGDPRALPRHQTMTALIDWSFDSLTCREQRLFESLAVFSGGCTLEAATAVCAEDDEDEMDILDLIASLVTKSLLVAEGDGGEQRYRLLESSRHYARHKLLARGVHSQLLQRHGLVYVELAERLERAWAITPDREWLPQVQVELGNWRAALESTLGKRCDVIAGQRLAGARHLMWRCFTLAEARRWVRAALRSVDENTPNALVARLEHAEADGAQLFGERKVSLAAAERALARYRELGDVLAGAWAQSLAAGSLVKLGRGGEAEALLHEALKTARTLRERRLTANVLQKIGMARSDGGDFAQARAHLSEALRLGKVLGAELFAASVAASIADNEFRAGDPETALRLLFDVLATHRALNLALAMPVITHLHLSIATYLIALGRHDDARMHANEGLELARTLGMAVLVAVSLQNLAVVEVLRPHVECPRTFAEHAGAARLFGFGEARHTALGMVGNSDLAKEYDRALLLLRDAIGADELKRLMAAGATMTEDEAIDQLYALEQGGFTIVDPQ